MAAHAGRNTQALAFSADDTPLASVAGDGIFHIQDVASGQKLRTRCLGPTRSIAFDLSAHAIATTSDQGAALWDFSYDTSRSLIGHPDYAYSFSFCPDGQTLPFNDL
jgi:WD40 repeat protein